MKSRVLRAALFLSILASFTGIGFQGYRWWSAHQRKQALSLYFRKNSPVTKRLPADATVYLNLLGARRIFEGSKNTRLYRVFSHWLDTGLGEDKNANPVLGGMLEKTLLDVFGEEFAIALAPTRDGAWDVMAVARLTPGSDLLLKLALSQNKKLQRTEFGEQTIFTVQTKNPAYPKFHVAIDSDFAYASSSIDRVRSSMSHPDEGPSFLQKVPEQSLPESTLLFLQTKDPKLSALGFLEGQRLRLQVQSGLLLKGPMPAMEHAENDVLVLITNLSEVLHQPAAAYSIRNVEGSAASSVVMAFQNSNEAQGFAEKQWNEHVSESIENVQYDTSSCFRYPHSKGVGMVCQNGALILIADGRIDPRPVLTSSTVEPARKHPLTFQVRFHKEAVSEYASLADNEDWSAFAQSKGLYFLSCLRSIQGSIDGNGSEIIAEIQ